MTALSRLLHWLEEVPATATATTPAAVTHRVGVASFTIASTTRRLLELSTVEGILALRDGEVVITDPVRFLLAFAEAPTARIRRSTSVLLITTNDAVTIAADFAALRLLSGAWVERPRARQRPGPVRGRGRTGPTASL